MSFIINKKILKKILISLLLISTVFSFFINSPVQAIDLDSDVLLNPIMTLFVSIGDICMSVVEDVLMQTNR